MTPRVHVLGLGSIGTFVAHSLAEIPQRPAVTLLLHRPSLMDSYLRKDKKILLKTIQGEVIANGSYGFEVLRDNEWYTTDPDLWSSPSRQLGSRDARTGSMIEHLIVCVKATQTVDALHPLLSRLGRQSTIMFLQNGAGMIEDVNDCLFRDPYTRPNYMTGVISHGVTLNNSFDITHTGFAATSIGAVPRGEDSVLTDRSEGLAPLAHYLLQALPQVPRLNCRSFEWLEVFQLQLEKLSTNAFCNPLCALADSPNKYLFTIPEMCRALISEISSVVLALPELHGVDGVRERFSSKSLEETVMSIIDRTRETTCSMVWDLRAGRETEVRYINGYWVRRGRELGIPTPLNEELVQKIQSRTG
ncbi:6-phosphogluconate dehydrogenase C-terminal domain-like protein [Pyrenochaeta sp. DS3sAY3a]|nr:6-phosphogluconate dehydrogenase C-terminal domain-like protein [Pyrenochaeta sp. DS3sAY3a]